MKNEIKKYKIILEIQAKKDEYEKLKGISGEKRLLYNAEEDEIILITEEN